MALDDDGDGVMNPGSLHAAHKRAEKGLRKMGRKPGDLINGKCLLVYIFYQHIARMQLLFLLILKYTGHKHQQYG